MPMPAMAISAPAAWTTAMGRYCAIRWRCLRSGAVTDEAGRWRRPRRGTTAAMRRMRRTRMRSAATSGAGGHEAPLGHPAASSACTSAAVERPLTTRSAVTRRSPMVAMGRSASARMQSDVQVGAGLDLERRLLAVVQEHRRQPQPAAVLVHDLGGGPGAGEEARVEVGQLGDERPAAMTPDGAGLDGRAAWRRGRPRRRSGAGRARSARPESRRPTGPAGLAAEGPPDAARRHGHHERRARAAGPAIPG